MTGCLCVAVKPSSVFSTSPAANVLQLNYPIHSSSSHDITNDDCTVALPSNRITTSTTQATSALVNSSSTSNGSSRQAQRITLTSSSSQQLAGANFTNNNLAVAAGASSVNSTSALTMNFSGQHSSGGSAGVIRPQRAPDGSLVNNVVSVTLNSVIGARSAASGSDAASGASGLKNARFFPVSLATRCVSPATPAVLKLASTAAQQLKNNTIAKCVQ